MATRRKSTPAASKKKKGGLGRTIILVIISIVVLAAVALSISYFYIKSDRKSAPDIKEIAIKEPQKTTNELASDYQNGQSKSSPIELNEKEVSQNQKQNKNKSSIDGTWVSTTNGAMLSLENESYLIDFPSVEKIEPLNGHFVVKDKNITFIATGKSEACGTEPGQYTFSFVEKDLVFNMIGDKCDKRSKSITARWFKLK
jgi:hypothetical protein